MNLDKVFIPTSNPPNKSPGPHLTSTVVICTRNRPSLLKECLDAVCKQSPPATQILVIDNSEGSSEIEQVARNAGARYCVEPVQGLSRARNRGLCESTTDVVVFLDDDAVPAANWLRLLVAAFADERIGAATGKIVTPESAAADAIDDTLRRLNKQTPQWFEIATFGGLGLGGNMALRRSASVGRTIFDERLGRGGPFQIAEEHYAFAYLISLGFDAVYLPQAIVHHPTLRRGSVDVEARNAFAYWLLLLADFPGQRRNLLSFLIRRLRRKPLSWPRHPREAGELVSSSLRVKLSAAFSGAMLFLTTPKQRRGNS